MLPKLGGGPGALSLELDPGLWTPRSSPRCRLGVVAWKGRDLCIHHAIQLYDTPRTHSQAAGVRADVSRDTHPGTALTASAMRPSRSGTRGSGAHTALQLARPATVTPRRAPTHARPARTYHIKLSFCSSDPRVVPRGVCARRGGIARGRRGARPITTATAPPPEALHPRGRRRLGAARLRPTIAASS